MKKLFLAVSLILLPILAISATKGQIDSVMSIPQKVKQGTKFGDWVVLRVTKWGFDIQSDTLVEVYWDDTSPKKAQQITAPGSHQIKDFLSIDVKTGKNFRSREFWVMDFHKDGSADVGGGRWIPRVITFDDGITSPDEAKALREQQAVIQKHYDFYVRFLLRLFYKK